MLTSTADTLSRVAVLTAQIAELNHEREIAVSTAMAAGSTWAEVALRLGCTPQSAHRRYRWLRHNDKTGETWHERPLPI